MAKAKGAKIIVTAGSKKKCDVCIKLGASNAINYNKEDYYKKIMEYTNNKGVDLVSVLPTITVAVPG